MEDVKIGHAYADFDGSVFLEVTNVEPFSSIDLVVSDDFRGKTFDVVIRQGKVMVVFPFGVYVVSYLTVLDKSQGLVIRESDN